MKPLEVLEKGGLRLSIYQDEMDSSPREWDNFGTMLCFHRSYDLGDKGLPYREKDYENWSEVHDALVADGARFIHPLYLMDHSGLSMTMKASRFAAVDSYGWDWGQVGFIYVTPDDLANCGWDPDTEVAAIERCLAGEIKTYDLYLRGEVYAYTLERVSKCDHCDTELSEVVDACGGFYSLDDIYGYAGWDKDAA